MNMSNPLNHLGSIWYHSEPQEVPYFPNQFLGWDFFCCFLQQTGSRTTAYLSNIIFNDQNLPKHNFMQSETIVVTFSFSFLPHFDQSAQMRQSSGFWGILTGRGRCDDPEGGRHGLGGRHFVLPFHLILSV